MFPLAYHNWRRPLPRPIVIHKVMTLATLDDVRLLVHRHLPPQYREKQTWQRVASIATAAARGQLPPEEVSVALWMVLQLEASDASSQGPRAPRASTMPALPSQKHSECPRATPVRRPARGAYREFREAPALQQLRKRKCHGEPSCRD